ncbi:MAG TPA: hypothetical protein VK588_03235, partial [Chitinophagaceae bacterium]|nr:hypothetical protein [Chitinophagaceae bacterium]
MFFERVIGNTQKKIFSVIFLVLATVVLSSLVLSCRNSASSEDEDEKLEMDGTEKAMRQEFLMTRDPALNMVPTERLFTALNYMKNARTTRTNNLTWAERGPNNIGGRCRAILVDKRDATGNTV